MDNYLKNILYGIVAVSTVAIMFFVVLPHFPNLSNQSGGFSLKSLTASAWGDWGGSGDYGGGCCDGGGYGGGSSDTTGGWGNWGGTGDYGAGCCDGGGYTPETPSGGGDTPPPPPPPPVAKCNYLTADRTTVPYGGGPVVLTWSTTNATSVTINGGSNHANGSATVNPSTDTTYTLIAVGAGGNDSCTVRVTMEPPQQPAAKCESLTANRTTVPYGGANVLLTWDTTNATSVSINNGVGTVSADGSKNVFVNSNVTYTLTAVGTGGNDTCTVSITVEGPTPVAKCEYLNISDTEVEEGDTVTLSWSTLNATSVSINQGIGTVGANGSRTVRIDNDTTFVLTATGTNGSDSCTARVEIEDEKEEKKKTPRCELDISKDRVKRGEKVTISWETKNVDEIVIKDDRGNTIFDTDDYSSRERKRYFNGEIDVIINQSTEFTMTAHGEDGGRKTCKVDVEVDDIAIYEKRDQAMVIALTQVPYTGFEAGAFLTFLFYAVLTLWALFIAYILVIKKGTILGFSLYGASNGVTEADVENRKKVEALVAKYADRSWK